MAVWQALVHLPTVWAAAMAARRHDIRKIQHGRRVPVGTIVDSGTAVTGRAPEA
jgi:hypothetical protein